MRIRKTVVCLMLVLGVAMVMATTAAAQGGDAGLRGTVTDDQGGALPGVTVTAASPACLPSRRKLAKPGSSAVRV